MSSYGTRSQMSPTVIGQAESVVERVYQAVEHLCTAPGDVRASNATAYVARFCSGTSGVELASHRAGEGRVF